MSLVPHKPVYERRWDGHLAIVKIDDTFFILHLTNPLSLSLSLSLLYIYSGKAFKKNTTIAGVSRKTSGYLALLLIRGGGLSIINIIIIQKSQILLPRTFQKPMMAPFPPPSQRQ
jgi:hypothetical protein